MPPFEQGWFTLDGGLCSELPKGNSPRSSGDNESSYAEHHVLGHSPRDMGVSENTDGCIG